MVGRTVKSSRVAIILLLMGAIFAAGAISIPTMTHNTFDGLQGGQTGQYYHLTEANYTSISNWDTAYDWGDHSAVGYLTELAEDLTPQLGGDLDGQSLYDLINFVDGTFSGSLIANDGRFDQGLWCDGTTGSTPTSGTGTRLMWIPAKGAFRAGKVEGEEWDDDNIGSRSVAMGYGTIASGGYSVAMGYGTDALGEYSVAMGWDTTTSGDYSMAMGYEAIASGNYSMAMGHGANASGGVSVAMGGDTEASEWYSVAMGRDTEASGYYSVAMGRGTNAESFISIAFGRYNVGGGTYDNWVATDPLFEIGIGADDDNRANALTVLKNGNTTISGTLGAGAITGTSFIIGGNTLDTTEWAVLDGVDANMVLDWTSASVGTIDATNIEDKFLRNDGNDTTSGTLTAGGFATAGTLDVGANLTISEDGSGYARYNTASRHYFDFGGVNYFLITTSYISMARALRFSDGVGVRYGGGQDIESEYDGTNNWLRWTGDPAGTPLDLMYLKKTGELNVISKLRVGDTTVPTLTFEVKADSIRIVDTQSPASDGTGTQGEIAWDADFIYVCTATDTWERAALTGSY